MSRTGYKTWKHLFSFFRKQDFFVSFLFDSCLFRACRGYGPRHDCLIGKAPEARAVIWFFWGSEPSAVVETPCIQRACAQAGEAAAADAASAAQRALGRAQVLLTRLGVRHLGASCLSLEEQRACVALQSERVPAAGPRQRPKGPGHRRTRRWSRGPTARHRLLPK